MSNSVSCCSGLVHLFEGLCQLTFDLSRLLLLAVRSRSALAAENLFLRKQLALFQEREVAPRRATDATRWLMVFLGQFFEWRRALVLVKPETLIGWHRKGFHLFWRWKSRPRGRPQLPADLQQLIRTMGADNPTWGEARIADGCYAECVIAATGTLPSSPPSTRHPSVPPSFPADSTRL